MSQSISVSNITDAVNSIITTCMQEAGDFVSFDQSFTLDCSDFAAELAANLKECMETNKNRSPADQWTICGLLLDPYSCTADSVKLNQLINVNLSPDQINQVSTTIKNTLSSSLQSNIQGNTGAFSISDKTSISITNLSKEAAYVVQQNIQDVYSSMKGKQVIHFKNGTYSYITLSQTADKFDSYFQNDTTFTTLLNSVIVNISADITEQLGGINLILNITFGVIGFFVLFGLCLFIIKSLNRKK